LQDGSRGIFTTEAWDVGDPQVHSGVLVPEVPILLGPLHPPSMIYLEGVFDTAMNPATDRIEVVLGDQTRNIPLSGEAGDSMLAAVFVYP
jgi:hypothetical protein